MGGIPYPAEESDKDDLEEELGDIRLQRHRMKNRYTFYHSSISINVDALISWLPGNKNTSDFFCSP